MAKRFAMLAALLMLAGCVAVPEGLPPAGTIDRLALEAAAPAGNTGDWPADGWWKAYGDPQLERLIDMALAGNPTLAGARARLAQAEAAAGIARGGAAPQVEFQLDASRGRFSANHMIPPPPIGPGGEYADQGRAVVALSYDLDLWGRHRALIAAAQDLAGAAAFDHVAARLALTTGIARLYAQLASQYERLDIAEAILKQRRSIAELTGQRVAAGLDTAVESRQAETGVAAVEAEAIQLQTAIAVTRQQLVVMAGEMPAAATGIARPRLQVPPFNVPASLPLDLLGRRPEIAAQRTRLAAAREAVQAARADFYPNINLTALIGYQAIGLDRLLRSGSQTSSLGPALHLPIFEGGRLRANYAGRLAEVDGAVAQYNQSVLAAAQEVVELLTRSAALDREGKATGEALRAAEDAYRIALLRYREGLSSYLSVLAVENQLLAQRRTMAELQARRLDLQIGLVRALGGGFIASSALPDNIPSAKS